MDGFFQNLSSGSFHPASPWEILGFLGLITVAAVFFALYSRRARNRLERNRRRRSNKAYQGGLGLLQPSPTDARLLELLADRLGRPEEEKHLLLSKREVFDQAEADLLETFPDKARDLMALRVRLGYGARTDGRTLRNSADIPPATKLTDAQGNLLFRVLSVHPGFLLAENASERDQIAGKGLELYISRPDGKYLFRSAVLKSQEDRSALQHDAELKRIQARDYFRRDIALPVRINTLASRTYNLSGGGACVERPPGDYSLDDVLGLLLELEPAEAGIPIQARVAHADDPGRLHLEFLRIREGDRDRIIRALMTIQRQDASSSRPDGDINLDSPGTDSERAMDLRDDTGSSIFRT